MITISKYLLQSCRKLIRKNVLTTTYPTVHLRRLRQHPVIRSLIRETELNLDDLVHAIFIKGDTGEKKSISTMPGHYQLPLSKLEDEIEEIQNLGIKSVILFGIPDSKDEHGSDSFNDNGIIQKALCKIRAMAPDLFVITDVCLCQYTDHGHCGFLYDKQGQLDIHNDQTLDILSKQAISHVKAGSQMIAPSGMIDGMVSALRKALDDAGFCHIPILSYSVKYWSAMYGPFGAAAEGAPKFGDRRTYQMDPANGNEAFRETELDVLEGADILMVKPAHTYLDIIYRIKKNYPHIPLCAYHTSGEFCMIKASSEKGWIDERRAVFEVLTSIKRAGADFIINYYTKEIANWMKAGFFLG